MFILGLILGVGIRVIDLRLQTSALSAIFSQMCVWILLCTLISIYSPTPRDAMYNVFPFCMNMLVAYYIYDDIVSGETTLRAYLWWSVVAVIAPILAYCTWYTKEKGAFSRVIRWGVLLFSIFSNILMFDGFKFYDIIINTMLAYFLFFQKTNRQSMRRRLIMRQISEFKKYCPEVFTSDNDDVKTNTT